VVAAHTPGVGAKILAIIFTISPRFGPLRALDFKPATPLTERMFLASLDAREQFFERRFRRSIFCLAGLLAHFG
jgi:hypothetical protein